MIETSFGLELPEVVLTNWRNPEENEKVTISDSSRMYLVQEFQWNSLIWNLGNAQIPSYLGLKMFNLHNSQLGEICEWATKHCTDQAKVKWSTWYPITMPESLGLVLITDSELTVLSGHNKPANEDPIHQIWDLRDQGVSVEVQKMKMPPFGTES